MRKLILIISLFLLLAPSVLSAEGDSYTQKTNVAVMYDFSYQNGTAGDVPYDFSDTAGVVTIENFPSSANKSINISSGGTIDQVTVTPNFNTENFTLRLAFFSHDWYDETFDVRKDSDERWYFNWQASGALRCYDSTYRSIGGGAYLCPNGEFCLFHIVSNATGSITLYINEIEYDFPCATRSTPPSGRFQYHDSAGGANSKDTSINGVIYYNNSKTEESGPTALNITLINCTSEGGDTISPYETTDTTPSFKIETNEDALCAISNANATYVNMVSGANSYRNCTNTGGQQHNCTLHPDDALILNETDYAYIACRDINETDDDTRELKMSMTTPDVETEGESAIQAGIETSVIWQYTPTVYNNQQVYLRDLNNNQILGTFDRLASYGSQRWAFNYITSAESFISGLFNLTTAFYAAEYQELTYQAVNDSVRVLINETKT